MLHFAAMTNGPTSAPGDADTALLLIGFQNDYFSPGGALYDALEDKAGVEDALRNSLRLIEALQPTRSPIISTPISFNPGYPEIIEPCGILKTIKEVGAFQSGQPGSEIIPEHAAFADRIQIVTGRHGLNAFAETELGGRLKQAGVKEVIITGVVTSLCVDSTARSAVERGFRVTVVADAVCGRTTYENKFYLGSVFPMYARINTTDELLADLPC
jgi:nicotinamidase-related amidase